MNIGVSSKGGSAKVKVLVIDDDEIAREFLVSTLKRGGFQASALSSPIGATKRVVDDGIAVVVLDVMMPTLSGDKLATLLRKNPALANLGVVLVSGSPHHEVQHLVAQVKADGLVSKNEVRTALVPAVTHAAKRWLAAHSS